jgi:hypothetical protein
MDAICGITLPDSLSFLKKTLRQWIALQKRCARIWRHEPDAFWWNNERAEIGAFAGAIWLCGGTALEEYYTDKRPRMVPKKPKRKAPGRCDLYFSVSGRNYVAEAKKCWTGLSDSPDAIRRKLRAAANDVRRERTKGCGKFAIVFVAPRGKVPRTPSARVQLTREIDTFVGDTRNALSNCGMAWVFPPEGRKLIWKKRERCYPGSVIVIKEIKPDPRRSNAKKRPHCEPAPPNCLLRGA